MLPSEQRTLHFEIWSQPVRLREATRRGKNFQHVALAARGTRAARSEWMKLVGGALQRTLRHLLGPEAPLEALLESALFEAATAWPPRRDDEPISIWVQRIGTDIALRHLAGTKASPRREVLPGERPGGVGEVLAAVYGSLRKLRPEEQVAFALLDLAGRSSTEAGAVLRAPPVVVRRRASRARQHLAFAARSDRLLARYMCIASRLRALARRFEHGALAAFCGNEARPVRPEVEVEVQWFV